MVLYMDTVVSQKLAIFIDSFDDMVDVWPYYFRIFDKYWPMCKLHRYLVTNNLDYHYDNLICLKTGDDKNWFSMTYKALSRIREKYVFFMIEDDFMSRVADEGALDTIIKYMEKENVFFYRFTCPYNFPHNQGFLEVKGNVIYPISIQPAIWNREKLLMFLTELQANGCVSPWDFERFFIDLYKDYDKDTVIPGIRYDSRKLFGFTNGVIQGKWDPRIVKYYKRRGIHIDTKQRGTMPIKKVIIDEIKRSKYIRSMSFEKQLAIKRVLKKIGFKFIT